MKTEVCQKLGGGGLLVWFFLNSQIFLLVENNSLKIILIYMAEKYVRLRQLISFPGMSFFSLNPQTFERLWPGGLHLLNVIQWSTFSFQHAWIFMSSTH